MKTYLLGFFAFISIIIINSSVYSQVNQEWVSIFNGSANSLDYSLSAAVDNAGNVIITGNATMSGTGRDFATVKYNSSGVQQWVRTYNGEAFGGDYSNAIAVDQSNNIYVSGRSDRGGSVLSDITTIKYNSAGVQQWIAFYNGPGSGVDEGFALILDGSGNVYVAGRCMGSTGQDMVVIKYNNSGVQQWAQTYDGTANSLDAARSAAVDAAGDVYICGWSYGSTSGSDFMVIKYNSSGVLQWAKRINGTGNGGDAAEKIKIDAAGGIYAAGYVTNSGSGYDFYTVKYNSSGTLQWEHTYNGPDNLYDLSHSMDLDEAANVYVGGESQKSGPNYDFALVKYSSSGTELWTRRFNGSDNGNDHPYCVITDSRGNSYIGGTSSTLTSGMDFELIKYNPEGIFQWSQTYNGTGNSHDYLRSIALDGLNYVYVTGESFGGASSYDYATIKYFECALIVNAGNDTSIIWGYGNQTAVLTASQDGGIEPVTYHWSTGAQTQTINVSPEQTTAYTVSATDYRGCTANDTVVVYVTNVRCGPGNHKVLVCHKGKNTLCIDSNAVWAHLNHGDQLGPCENSNPVTEIPLENKLYANYPNPFNPSTLIKFSLSEASLVRLIIYDYIGREVKVLIDARYETGTFVTEWNAVNYPSGVYFFRLEAGTYTETKKMILLK